MTVYTAKIKHSEDTIKAMAKAQYECFRSKSYYVMLVFAIVLLALAIFVSAISQGIKTLMIAVGCFTVVGLGSPPKQLAKQVIKNLNGKFPVIRKSNLNNKLLNLEEGDSVEFRKPNII